MKASLPVGLVLLLGLGAGCNGRKAEEARAAVARAQEEQARRAESDKQAAALEKALVELTSSMTPAKAREDFKLARAKVPSRHHAAIAKLEACQADGIEEVQKAAEQKAYATIANVAVGCIASMEDLVAETRRAFLQELLTEKESKPDDAGLALLKLQNATRDFHYSLLVLLVDHGPEDARAAAFDVAAAELAKRAAAGATTETLASVLQRAHEGGKTSESKARMAARLKELGVPLEAASPAPAAAGAGS